MKNKDTDSSSAIQTLTDESPRNRVARHLRDEILSGRIAEGESMPTERQIADALGVARGTVRAAFDLLEQESLIYARKHAKRVVAPRRSLNQGLLSRTYLLVTDLLEVPDFAPQSGFIGAVETGIFRAGNGQGLHAMLLQQNCLSDGYLAALLQERPRGVLVTSILINRPKVRQQLEQIFQDSPVPVVVNSEQVLNDRCDRVCFDHFDGSRQLTDLLLKRGREKILRVWTASKDTGWIEQRNRGHAQCLQQGGITPLPPVHVENLPSNREAFEARSRCYAGYLVEHLRGENPPQAIMVTTDADVFAVAEACRLCGVEPGENLDIVGYDNNWRDAPERELISYVPPASVDKHNYLAGCAMIELLQQRYAQQDLKTQTTIIPQELVLTC